jgi:hypothetical protein
MSGSGMSFPYGEERQQSVTTLPVGRADTATQLSGIAHHACVTSGTQDEKILP